MLIWIVSSGEYSDYHVHCAFTTEELATDYAARRAGLTRAEYDELVRFENRRDIWGDTYHAAFEALPEKLRNASSGSWTVDSRQLYDAPVVLTAEEAEEAAECASSN